MTRHCISRAQFLSFNLICSSSLSEWSHTVNQTPVILSSHDKLICVSVGTNGTSLGLSIIEEFDTSSLRQSLLSPRYCIFSNSSLSCLLAISSIPSPSPPHPIPVIASRSLIEQTEAKKSALLLLITSLLLSFRSSLFQIFIWRSAQTNNASNPQASHDRKS